MNNPLAALALISALCGATLVAQTPPVPPGVAGEAPKAKDAVEAGQRPQVGESGTHRLRTGGPNSWFKHTQLQMGDHLKKDVVKGRFPFKNPHKEEMLWSNLSGSCQCAKVIVRAGKRKYILSKHPRENTLHEVTLKEGVEVLKPTSRIRIDGGAVGEVEVHMEMAGIEGIKDASVQFATTDEKHPMMMLKWEAMGIKLFNISPPDVFMNDLEHEDQRVFRFTISSPVKKDFKLLDHEPLPPYVKVKKKQIKLPNGQPAWEVSGTFGPKADKNSGGATIKFRTDLDDKVVKLGVIAHVKGPLSIQPGTFMALPLIRRGKGGSQQVTLVASGGFQLKVEKVEFQNLSIDRRYLSVEHVRDGSRVTVTLKVLPGAKARTPIIRGSIILHLNHPDVKTQKIGFAGALR